jgi:hypothetical protein
MDRALRVALTESERGELMAALDRLSLDLGQGNRKEEG